jgi:diguanylate cyclase (GGDEF)-like protein
MEITNDMNIEPIDTSKLLAADIATLGGELKLVVHLIVDEVRERTQISNHVLDDDVENLFLAASRSSTEAFALWMTSGNPDIARQAGLDASQIFGQLAARNDAPLNEVAKRCMRWHDVVALHLTESAPRLGVPDCVSEALAMLQRSLRVTIVRMTESFERERLRMQESLTLQQEKIAFLASHDALTGLPSRSLIMDRIGQLLVRHRRYESDATVIFLDIDDFKAVNDSLGHEAGDHLLKAVGERLGAVLRDTDTLGRLGGDEFIVVADCVPPNAAPEVICQRLLAAFEEPFDLRLYGYPIIQVAASVGMATGSHLSVEDILKRADIAMYQAKRDGKNRFVNFEMDMLPRVGARLVSDPPSRIDGEHGNAE